MQQNMTNKERRGIGCEEKGCQGSRQGGEGHLSLCASRGCQRGKWIDAKPGWRRGLKREMRNLHVESRGAGRKGQVRGGVQGARRADEDHVRTGVNGVIWILPGTSHRVHTYDSGPPLEATAVYLDHCPIRVSSRQQPSCPCHSISSWDNS